MATIISVSIEQKQKEFIDEMSISPSKLLQESINEKILNQRVSVDVIHKLRSRIESLQETIRRYGDFISEKGLMEEFIKE